ncbi:MAG TPA: thioredoxin family protein [Ignavibacteria bacterium]
MSHPATREILDNAYNYQSFRKMIDKLLAEGKTTGANHSPEMLDYTKLNIQRMNRLDKTTVINNELLEKLKNPGRKLIWMIIAEAWCGDVSMNVPVIAKIAENSNSIELRIILRDEYPEVMNAYLTNGGKAIPILVCFNAETLEELGKWGPRPAPVQKLIKELVANHDVPKAERTKRSMVWYAEDKTQTIQKEFLELIKIWEK